MCHPKICYFSIKDYFELKATEKSRYKKNSLLSPISLKTGHKFVKVSPLPSIPGRTKVNHRRKV